MLHQTFRFQVNAIHFAYGPLAICACRQCMRVIAYQGVHPAVFLPLAREQALCIHSSPQTLTANDLFLPNQVSVDSRNKLLAAVTQWPLINSSYARPNREDACSSVNREWATFSACPSLNLQGPKGRLICLNDQTKFFQPTRYSFSPRSCTK